MWTMAWMEDGHSDLIEPAERTMESGFTWCVYFLCFYPRRYRTCGGDWSVPSLVGRLKKILHSRVHSILHNAA